MTFSFSPVKSQSLMKRRRVYISDDEEQETPKNRLQQQALKKQRDEEMADLDDEAKPSGSLIKVDFKGKKKHYPSFEYGGNSYELDDTVLFYPGEEQKPYVGIIKEITEDFHGKVMVTGQWFYRPEEAVRKGGGNWEARDTRELFYSCHRDEVPAESVMHKCVIHFIPLDKQLPERLEHPGFIVQKVYDYVQKSMWNLTEKDCNDALQYEIDVLVKKTQERIGKLPDIELKNSSAKKNDYLTTKRSLARGRMHQIDVSRLGPTTQFDRLEKVYSSCRGDVSMYHVILSKSKVLTGNAHRDKWLEKLLQGIQLAWSSTKGAVQMDDRHRSHIVSSITRVTGKISARRTGPCGSASDVGAKIDAVIPLITELEKVVYEALGMEFQKYNQKMRQLDYNLKTNPLLSRRLLNKELEPIALLTMTPEELKEGLTADERIATETEKPVQMQMTDARCSRCMQKQVHINGIICAGAAGDRYELECGGCGNSWYASRDEMSSLTIDALNVNGNLDTPWATA
ncbi:uncharacterized protein A4U43_C04F14010 [Asparagus officinalis]|uniref:BAH domain-containing protein n=1 Tax=Asparagus officinalis TaxID=4686 RepID=A0A5P1F1C7_ASPOF|nr:uncharacterized protein LOC109837264 [Asparagus officinalis]ONK71944.1 uncharacterized protein A4U43_C04F14010 [Asparagus officinalis]